ncbi:hypothetical protein JRO89_XS09G0100100 [Xanthoceras sorbifolium]|uniref:GDSL esterase/lipase n=1 Tax=Xanthoceras sorbifolium TaxID=99658 RepID=A0ABQ8HKW1_9ROSI|nr:hypothetical protein JRO89_XS09G0100100 [Xanthoceras sorbifolium]
MRSWTRSFLMFSIFLDLLSGSHGDVFRVPPLDVTQKDLLQLLELGDDIKFDVPALYVFGDSTVDSGNNNFLPSISKANFPPFGIDFADGKPTGRFSNGRTEADFIAQVVGLPFPPPCLGLSKETHKTLRTGVNYGSSACGILPDTGKFFVSNIIKHVHYMNKNYEVLINNSCGTCLSFDNQIDLFETTVKNLQPSFDGPESMANYLSKSLFFISIGSADVSMGYDILDNITKQKTPFPNFAQAISQKFSSKIQKLYDLGARKYLVNNIGMMGCSPVTLNSKIPMTATCDDEINKHAQIHNKLLSDLLQKLQSELSGSKFIKADVYKVFSDIFASPNSYGMTDTRDACCVAAEHGTRPCIRDLAPCNNRNEHVYFDPFHASESTNFILAKRCLKESSICTPISLVDLLRA